RGPVGGLPQQVSGLLLGIRQRRGRLVAGLVPYFGRMRVGLREDPAGQLDRARVPGRRRDWGRGRRRDWGRLAFGPARVVVGAQRRLGGGPARIRPARPARVIGVQGPRTRPAGPARVVVGVHGGTADGARRSGGSRAGGRRAGRRRLTGGLFATGGGPWRGGHPGVAAGPAAAVGGRSGRIRGGGDPPGIRGPPGP